MALRDLFEKILLLQYKKIPLSEFKKTFSDTLYVAGGSLDNKVLNFITTIDLDTIKRIIILTPYSNLDKQFMSSWGGLSKFLYSLHIELIMKAPSEKVPLDVFFLDKKSTLFIPRNYFEKKISEVSISTNYKTRDQIMNAFASAEDFTHLRGTDVYYKKFNKLFQIDKRYLSDKEKEKVLVGLYLWESSDYEDIEPLWRILERKTRNFIKIRLKQENSSNWFSLMVLPCFKEEFKEAIINRFEKSKGPGINNIDEHPNPMGLLVAENYENIINYRANKHLFSDFQDNKNKKYVDYFRDCVKARNPSIHDRTPDEGTDLYSNTIVKILMLLEWLNRLEVKLLSYDI